MKYKVGDKVYCPLWGQGKVIEINEEKNPEFPIIVQFKGIIETYTESGQFYPQAKSTLNIYHL